MVVNRALGGSSGYSLDFHVFCTAESIPKQLGKLQSYHPAWEFGFASGILANPKYDMI